MPAIDVVERIASAPVSRTPVAVIPSGIYPPKPRAALTLATMKPPVVAPLPALPMAMEGMFRLEVSNGNGVSGLAKRVSRMLVRQGIPVHSLTNQQPYQQAVTEIRYRDGFEQAATVLRGKFRGYATMVRVVAPQQWVDLRVVLGKDILAYLTQIDTEQPLRMANLKSATGQLE